MFYIIIEIIILLSRIENAADEVMQRNITPNMLILGTGWKG